MDATQQNSDLSQTVKDVEKDLLKYIVENMRNKKISVGRAKSLAQDFLKLLPPKDKEDLLNKLLGLSKKYYEAGEVYVDFKNPAENDKREQALDLLREHLQNGDIEKAIETAKGVTRNG